MAGKEGRNVGELVLEQLRICAEVKFEENAFLGLFILNCVRNYTEAHFSSNSCYAKIRALLFATAKKIALLPRFMKGQIEHRYYYLIDTIRNREHSRKVRAFRKKGFKVGVIEFDRKNIFGRKYIHRDREMRDEVVEAVVEERIVNFEENMGKVTVEDGEEVIEGFLDFKKTGESQFLI